MHTQAMFEEDIDDENMTEAELDANTALRFRFIPALQIFLMDMGLNLDQITGLSDEIDTLMSMFKPSDVEYLIAFLTALIPQITTTITLWAQTREHSYYHSSARDAEHRLYKFVAGINNLLELFQIYHRAGRIVDETKLLELHLDLLVTLKTEVCYAWIPKDATHHFSEATTNLDAQQQAVVGSIVFYIKWRN